MCTRDYMSAYRETRARILDSRAQHSGAERMRLLIESAFERISEGSLTGNEAAVIVRRLVLRG